MQNEKIIGYALACQCGCPSILKGSYSPDPKDKGGWEIFEDPKDALKHGLEYGVTKIKRVEIVVLADEEDEKK